MNCTRFHLVLDAHIDGELDHATHREIAAHLAQCEACTTLHTQRVSLRDALRTHAPRYKAPATLAPALRQALAQSAREQTTAPTQTPKPWFVWPSLQSWLPAAAFATVAALAGLIGGYWLAQPQPDYPLRDPAVASHVAALSPTRQLIQVASSDRHTVKPWFQGKLDFAPPVIDLTSEGYTLVGARLDQVADKPAAAVVYQVRKHIINLFVWRATDLAPEALATSTLRGFSVATWATDGLRFAAVSDVGARDLTQFAQRIKTPESR